MVSEEITPHVYTIPAGWPFVDALATGIQEQFGEAPDALARVTVLLPTRRACRSLRDAFLRIGGGRPTLLPRMLPLGDMDEDELLISAWEDPGIAGDGGLSLPPAMPGLRRQLLLTRLILARPDKDTTPDQAVRLAKELGRLLDQIHTERVELSGLADLVPEEFAAHWQITLDFLKVLTDVWPELLAAENCLDPADRRNRLLEARTQLWRNQPPSDPVIAAGSTGSIPATADLLSTIALLPNGCVVLPGLDRDASDGVWDNLSEGHPQYGMARLIEHMGLQRSQVSDWPLSDIDATQPARSCLINAALAPAAAELQINGLSESVKGALDSVTRLDCPGPREEACAIALMMRQTLEEPGKTAALVTPDRGLARRVTAELSRWQVSVDDSAGHPLADTQPGAFLRLIAAVAVDDLAPVSLLALLKHPMAAAGLSPAVLRRQTRQLEMAVLRGPRPDGGLEGLRDAIPDKHPDLIELVQRLDIRMSPLLNAMRSPELALNDLVHHHVKAAEAMAETDNVSGAERLWSGEAGDAAAGFISELIEHGTTVSLAPGYYPAFFDALVAGRVVRPHFGAHPRLSIWGPLEARLQRADTLILGGLNEGTWPSEVQVSPWMNRSMMSQFGLPLPERRIGLSAHDFTQGFAAPEVVLTRAERVEGTPTVPCRWTRRFDNLLERLDNKISISTGAPWLQWVESLDAPIEERRCTQPKPTPPVEFRPRELSVTRIETWIRDPYALYANKVLGLRALEKIDAAPDAADRGTIVHKALEEFVRQFPDDLPDNAMARLLEIGQDIFQDTLARPGVRAFWWPRFERLAEWFVAWERDRRKAGWQTVLLEKRGEISLDGPFGRFKLTAKPDRIDFRADVGLSILDYKTGTTPSAPMVASGLAPQLSLEAAIARAGGFQGLPSAAVAQLLYVRLSGGREPGEEKPMKLDVDSVVEDAYKGLANLIAVFDNPNTPYLPHRRPKFLDDYGDYGHLARIKEWRLAGGDRS